MSTVPANAATGQALFEGTQSLRAHDDQADNKVGAVYSHVPTEFSATEAEEWCDLLRYHNTVIKSGVAIPLKNNTGGILPAGTLVFVSSYDSATSAYILGLSDSTNSAKPAQYVLLASLAIGAVGTGYSGGSVAGLNTSAGSVGDPVYLSSTLGGWSLTPATKPQIVGRITVDDPVSGAIGFNIQNGADTLAGLFDVSVGTASQNSILYWDAATSLWKATLSPASLSRIVTSATVLTNITAAQSGCVFTNDAAGVEVIFNLPTAATGLQYEFVVTAAQNLKVVAASGDYLRDAALSSSSAGYAQANATYTRFSVVAVDSTNWVIMKNGIVTLG
jgi:hypothetical protein